MAIMLTATIITHAQWIDLGSANNHPLNANYPILSLATGPAGVVYAAGEFHDTTTIKCYVAKWTGDTAWTKLGTGSHSLNANGYIYSIATDSAGSVYAAGAFTDQTYQSSGNVYVAKWVDTAWVKLGTNGVAPVPNTAGSAILSIALDPSGNVYAAGEFKDAHSTYYVSKWNGTTWAELGTGVNALNANNFIQRITTDPFGNVYAAGDFTDSSGSRYVAMWDGTTWTEMGTGSNALNAAGSINALTSDMSGNIYVAYDDTSYQFYVAEWNGNNWTQVGSGANALAANSAITTLTTDALGNLYAGGNFTDANNQQYVAMWNGTTWSELGTGRHSLDPNSYILSVAIDTALDVYAAGYFTDANNKYFVSEYDPYTQGPNGIAQIQAGETIQVYPSPASDLLSVRLDDYTPASAIDLLDLTGRPVMKKALASSLTTLSVSTLTEGLYLYRVTDGSGAELKSGKVVVER